METNDIEKMIKQNLKANPSGMEIDIRREIMSRIEVYEGRKTKVKDFILWALSIFTFCAGLASIFLFEGLLVYYKNVFLRINVDMTTVKFVFQGVFMIFVLVSLTVMISQVKPMRHINRSLFMLSF